MITWKPVTVPGFDTSHEVSDHGHVASIDRTVKTKKGQRRLARCVLALDTHSKGYPSLKLHHAGRRKRMCVHKLVVLAFIGPAPGPVGVRHGEWSINHKDGDKTNNHVSNLEWTQVNREHAKEMGLIRCGEDHPHAKLKERDVRLIRYNYATGAYTYRELGEMFGVSRDHIGTIVRREVWKSVA